MPHKGGSTVTTAPTTEPQQPAVEGKTFSAAVSTQSTRMQTTKLAVISSSTTPTIVENVNTTLTFSQTPPLNQIAGGKLLVFQTLPLNQMTGKQLVVFLTPPLNQMVRNETMAFQKPLLTTNIPISTTIQQYQQLVSNNPLTQNSPLLSTKMLAFPFPQQAFYGPNPGHSPTYNNMLMQPYITAHQYNPHGALPIPNKDCLSRSIISPFARYLLDYEILNTSKIP